MRKMVAVGRGGVGKTSFIALMAKLLKDKGSLLLIDADPDESLAELLGIDLDKLQINTISDVLFDVRYDKINQRLKSFTLAEKIEFLVNQRALCEGRDFDLLSIGAKWTEGCYCQANNILKGLISELQKNYDYVLIDSPAGLEHLNRRVTSSIDDIFVILDPTKKALQHLERAYRIISEIRIKFTNFWLLGNFRLSDELLSSIKERIPSLLRKEKGGQGRAECIGRLEYDRNVQDFNFQGKSLFQLPEDSPVFASLKRIAAAAGY